MYIIRTVKGDITKITDVQAIVNAANESAMLIDFNEKEEITIPGMNNGTGSVMAMIK